MDAVHVSGGEQFHHIRRLRERDPVELKIRAGCEVCVMRGQVKCAELSLCLAGDPLDLDIGLDILLCIPGQNP